MGLYHGLKTRLRAMLRSSAADQELSEEIQFHITRQTEIYLARGLAPAEARRQALIDFGGVEQVREAHRDVRRPRWLEEVSQDVRLGSRSIRRSPGIATAVILTLGLGIGANVAIFSLVNAIILRPLPFPEPDRLVTVGKTSLERGWEFEDATPQDFVEWREAEGFSDVMAHINGVGTSVLSGADQPRLVREVVVTGNFFSVLGGSAALGRTMREEETWAESGLVAVLSDRAWRVHFAADSNVIGHVIRLNDEPLEVVGVMPPWFEYPEPGVDVWRSIGFSARQRAESGFHMMHYLRVVGRLAPDAAVAPVQSRLNVIAEQQARDRPESNQSSGALVRPLHRVMVGDTRLPLMILQGAVGLLLLIACANIANLLLVQASGRRRETALRLALGAGSGRVVRQALVQSLLLSCLGALLGIALAWAGSGLLLRLKPAGILPVQRLGIDLTVMVFVVVTTVATSLLFGMAPALWARRRDPAESLREGGHGTAGSRRSSLLANGLVMAEVGLALVLTIGGGLLVRSLMYLNRVDPGFDPSGLLAVEYRISQQADTSRVEAFNAQLLERASALPGVTAVAMTNSLSLTGSSWSSDLVVAGRPADEPGVEIVNRVVSPSYFTTMSVPVIRGRLFSSAEGRNLPPVVLVNDVIARSYFQGQDPVGQRLALTRSPAPDADWYTIVGVVGTEYAGPLDAGPEPQIYHSALQLPLYDGHLLLRSGSDPTSLAASVQSIIGDLDPAQPLFRVQTMEAIRSGSMAESTFLAALLLLFAGIGLVLAVVGVYGVLAHVTASRVREIGVRMALGARRGQVQWLVVRQGLKLLSMGLLGGGVVGLLAAPVMTTLLYKITPHDPLTIAAVAVLLLVTGGIAAWLPARAASRTDPSRVLRLD